MQTIYRCLIIPMFLSLVLLVAGCGESGSGSASFCEDLCSDATACIERISTDECLDACEGARDEAQELGGSACVDAHEDYLACVISDICDDVSEEDSECRLPAIDAEIEPCGEFVGEF